MNKYWVVAIVIIVCILVVIYTQRSSSHVSKKSLKQILQNAYPQYQVIEKQQDLIICEVDHRNLLQELVMIRIDPQQKKNMRTFGRRVTFTYPKPPELREMRKDFAVYLSTH